MSGIARVARRNRVSACRAHVEPIKSVQAATESENLQVIREYSNDCQWLRKPLVTRFDVDRDGKYVMRGVGCGGAEWEQGECPNWFVRRPTALNRHQGPPLTCDASCLGRSQVLVDGH